MTKEELKVMLKEHLSISIAVYLHPKSEIWPAVFSGSNSTKLSVELYWKEEDDKDDTLISFCEVDITHLLGE